jgi:N-glycosylase/DNA lyase
MCGGAVGSPFLFRERRDMFCQECMKKRDCRGICKALEGFLNKCQAKEGYSDRQYRRKNVPYDSLLIENLATRRASELKYGKKWTNQQVRKCQD